MGLVQKSFSDIITFSRSSNATRIGPTGLVEYAPHNLLTYSEQFNNAAWSKTGGLPTVTANVVAAPNGTITADKIAPSTSSNYQLIYQSITVSSSPVTLSCYAKVAEYQYLQLATNSPGLTHVVFNLSTGAVAYNPGGSGITANITSVGNNWYRCSITFTPSAGSVSFYIGGSNSPSEFQTSGDGTSGIYIWGAQLSVGPYALDYTPTTTAAVYGPRFDYDPVTLAARGLLIEEQRSNLLTYSEQFDNAAWTKVRSSITVNAATSPDGTVTADQSTIDNTNGFHDACVQSFSAVSGTSYSFSIFVKKSVGIEAVYFYTNAAGDKIAKFNLTTGAYIGNAAGNGYGAFSSYSSIALSNGWYRIIATVAANATASAVFSLGLSTNTNDTVTQFTGNGTDNVYVWGAQLEAGSFATSYIPTVAASVTRSADVASVNTLSPWYNATEGTLFAEFDLFINASNTDNQTVWSLNDGTASNEIFIYRSGGGNDGRFAVLTSGAGQADIDTGPNLTQNTVYKLAGAYKLNDLAASISGLAAVTDASGTIPTVSAMQIGAGRFAPAFNGHIRRIAYYPVRLSNAQLPALTA